MSPNITRTKPFLIKDLCSNKVSLVILLIRRRGASDIYRSLPPATSTMMPVIYAENGDASIRIDAAASSGVARRAKGT